MSDAKLIPLWIGRSRLPHRRAWWEAVDSMLADKGLKIDPRHPDNADGHPIYLQAGDSHICISSGEWPTSNGPHLYITDERESWEARFTERTPLSVVLQAIRELETPEATE